MPRARTDEEFHQLQELVALLNRMNASGNEVRIIGHTIMTRSGRAGWADSSHGWVARRYPQRG